MTLHLKKFKQLSLCLKLLLCLVSAVSSTKIFCASDADVHQGIVAEKTWPNTIIAPWQTPGIDADEVTQNASALSQSLQALASKVLKEPKSLTTFTTVNSALTPKSLSQALAGQRAAPNLEFNIVLFPTWAKFQNQDVVLLIAADSQSNVILGVKHRVIQNEKNTSSSKKSSKVSPDLFTKTVLELWDEMTPRFNEKQNPDLAISLGVANTSNRTNETDRGVLSLIAFRQNLPDFVLLNPIGYEFLASVHKMWSASGLFRRANRNLNFHWSYPYSKVPGQKDITLSLSVLPSDGVFGRSLPWSVKENVLVSITPSAQLSIKMTDQLTKLLAVESESLKRSENPMVAKTYRAWVYLDKGRAWGLRMNDRLEIQDGSSTVKGHIVGYFGPEMKLKSPRGWPIQEGAIMFVRKGQPLAKMGQEFIYDKMTVPAPWPPSVSAVK